VGDTGMENPAAVPGLFPQDQVVDEYDENGGFTQVPVTAPEVSLPRRPASTTSTTSTTSTSTSTAPADPTTGTTAPATPPPVPSS
jgi:hypothetical protein